jgi:hypothetical protein
MDFLSTGYGFETYEPDVVPTMVALEQRIRPTENAFTDFAVQVLKSPTKYTDAFSGMRKKGSQVGNWLLNDDDFMAPCPESYQRRMDEFRQAYIVQTQQRKEAEAKLDRMVVGRMDSQDKALMGGMKSLVMDFDQENEE